MGRRRHKPKTPVQVSSLDACTGVFSIYDITKVDTNPLVTYFAAQSTILLSVIKVIKVVALF